MQFKIGTVKKLFKRLHFLTELNNHLVGFTQNVIALKQRTNIMHT